MLRLAYSGSGDEAQGCAVSMISHDSKRYLVLELQE